MIASDLIKKYTIISDQVEPGELSVVLSQLESILVAGGVGSIVEFGCYIGSTSLFIQRILSQYNSSNTYHVFDSFEGLPEKAVQDYSAAGEQFRRGELLATKKQFVTNFRKAGLSLPVVHKAWFSQLGSADVPDDIIFAFLDGDYYDSIMDSLRLITPKLAPNAVIVVDDYANEALPGAARAVDEWLMTHQRRIKVQSSLAVLY